LAESRRLSSSAINSMKVLDSSNICVLPGHCDFAFDFYEA
jgi:hypothetical protein